MGQAKASRRDVLMRRMTGLGGLAAAACLGMMAMVWMRAPQGTPSFRAWSGRLRLYQFTSRPSRLSRARSCWPCSAMPMTIARASAPARRPGQGAEPF